MTIIEECFDCGKNVRADRIHWRLHITTSLAEVGADYAGEDSQGTFAVGPECRRKHTKAYRAAGLAQ